MTTRTVNTKGLDRPHKGIEPVKANGSKLQNARSIATEQGGHKPKVGSGLPSTYYGNSRACNTERGRK